MAKRGNISNFSKTIMRCVGRELTRYRKEENNLSQKQISEFLGISHETLSHYENGKVSIPFDTLLVLCMRYGIKQIHFSSGNKTVFGEPIDVDLNLDPVGLPELKKGLDIVEKRYRHNAIYEYIYAIQQYETNDMGKKILQLYLDYLAGFQSKSGIRLCNNAIMNIEAKEKEKYNIGYVERLLAEIETPKEPPTRASHIDSLSVEVEASY